MRPARWLPVSALAIALAVGAGLAAGVRPNLTPSLPVGLWMTGPIQQVRRGMAVEFCLPPDAARLATERGYIGTGFCPDGTMELLKPIAALPGDEVEITDTSIRVNGRFVVPAGQSRDSQGRPLSPMAPGLYRVAAGEVWALSDYAPASFDSRYWGPVPIATLRREARPLLTF